MDTLLNQPSHVCPQCKQAWETAHAEELQRCDRCGFPDVIDLGGEERTGTRFREVTIKVRTTWNDVGQVTQSAQLFNQLNKRVLNTMEAQTRDALIALGWAPPSKSWKCQCGRTNLPSETYCTRCQEARP